jgi:hypothetical protein
MYHVLLIDVIQGLDKQIYAENLYMIKIKSVNMDNSLYKHSTDILNIIHNIIIIITNNIPTNMHYNMISIIYNNTIILDMG